MLQGRQKRVVLPGGRGQDLKPRNRQQAGGAFHSPKTPACRRNGMELCLILADESAPVP